MGRRGRKDAGSARRFPGSDWDQAPTRPTAVLVMAEYSTGTPLWDCSPGAPAGAHLLHPHELGVSPELSTRLVAWNDRFGRLALNDFRWGSAAEEKAWKHEGLDLAHELQHELGRDVDVLYAHEAGGVAGGRGVRDGGCGTAGA